MTAQQKKEFFDSMKTKENQIQVVIEDKMEEMKKAFFEKKALEVESKPQPHLSQEQMVHMISEWNKEYYGVGHSITIDEEDFISNKMIGERLYIELTSPSFDGEINKIVYNLSDDYTIITDELTQEEVEFLKEKALSKKEETPTREEMIEQLLDYNIKSIIEDYKNEDYSLLYSAIVGNGFTQLNNMTNEELLNEYNEEFGTKYSKINSEEPIVSQRELLYHREDLIEELADDTLETLKENIQNEDYELLSAILIGDGFTQYNYMTEDELVSEYKEMHNNLREKDLKMELKSFSLFLDELAISNPTFIVIPEYKSFNGMNLPYFEIGEPQTLENEAIVYSNSIESEQALYSYNNASSVEEFVNDLRDTYNINEKEACMYALIMLKSFPPNIEIIRELDQKKSIIDAIVPVKYSIEEGLNKSILLTEPLYSNVHNKKELVFLNDEDKRLSTLVENKRSVRYAEKEQASFNFEDLK